MRGALLSLIVAGLALGGALVATSPAAESSYARADAVIAQDGDAGYGEIHSRRDGEKQIEDRQIDEAAVTVRSADATVRTSAGPRGYATVRALNVSVLDGRVVVGGIRRTAAMSDGDVHRSGGIYNLRIDGQAYGDVSKRRTIEQNGLRVILNTGDNGLRVVSDTADVRVAVAKTSEVVAEPTPTPTPTTTATATTTSSPPPIATQGGTTTTPTTPPVPRKHAPSTKRRLTSGGYAFPVYGKARVADNFGAARAKPIGIHEGVDIFAPFGSPVVAVRDGKIDHVGTLAISGNRLWLHTANGDAFFYAHLSAFSDAARNGAEVKAGTVLGFVGNTGDAEPTPPHLHFEVHPGGMDEDAVDPYPIVTAWQRRDDVPPGAWLQQLGPDATKRPGALVTVRDFIAE
ncbi:MAG: peptidoglycan LD-endopeptidase LytH [Solirubrobacteraceae bacterium]|nr:peptidoglycan LD-endopeptidase LytH [Solirubrobacteraceae bacterium]